MGHLENFTRRNKSLIVAACNKAQEIERDLKGLTDDGDGVKSMVQWATTDYVLTLKSALDRKLDADLTLEVVYGFLIQRLSAVKVYQDLDKCAVIDRAIGQLRSLLSKQRKDSNAGKD